MKTIANLFCLIAASLIAAAGAVHAQAQAVSATPGGSGAEARHRSKITLSSSDREQVQKAAQVLANAGHPVTMTETHTTGGGSKTWSFDTASSPVFKVSEVKPANSSSYSVSAVASANAASAQAFDAMFNCAQWTSKFNVTCAVEIVE